VRDLERSLKDALDFKFISSARTPQDLAGLFDIASKRWGLGNPLSGHEQSHRFMIAAGPGTPPPHL